ncbi:MAG: PorT family protein [Flavobacteriales bacterium]|nr:PorT family protein [Flavobacteriales bacterium]
MTFRTLLIASLSLTSAALSAQEFRFGGGYSGSNVREAGDEHWVGRAGYHAGVDLVLGRLWFVRPGMHLQVRNLNYTMVGLDENGDPFGTDVEFRYTDRALRVPLFVGRRLMDPSDDPGVNLYVMAGPTALFNLNADLDNDRLDVRTNGMQWYIGAGAGLEIAFLFVEGGYNVAMSNVFEGARFRTNPRVNQLNLSAGIRLRLAK